MVKLEDNLTDVPNIGKKRAEVLVRNGISSVEDIATVEPTWLVEIFAGQISPKQATQIVEHAKGKTLPAKGSRRVWRWIVRHWVKLVAFAGAVLIFLDLAVAYFDLRGEVNKNVLVNLSYAESLEAAEAGTPEIQVDRRSLSVVNLGFPYENFEFGEYAICAEMPFLLETSSTSIIDELTLVFEVDYPSQGTFDLAETAGYGSYIVNPGNACAYKEKTDFTDEFGRTTLSRTFHHSDGRTRVVYQYENLLPGEPIPISIAIPITPNTFLGFGEPIKKPFHQEKGNGDFSNEALSNSEISLISEPISLSFSYILDGPRQHAGNMLFYVHPASLNADLVFPAFLLAENHGYDRRLSLRQIWSGEATQVFFQHLTGQYVPDHFIESILSDPEDVDLREKQYDGENVILEVFPVAERVSYVSDRSKVLASIGSLFSNASDPMVFDMEDFNYRRNLMRTELLLSHQFPSLFQRYLEQED